MQEKKIWLIQANKMKINTYDWKDQKSSASYYSLLREKYPSFSCM